MLSGQIWQLISGASGKENASPTTRGISVLTLPPYVRTLQRVTWRGKSLEPQSWERIADAYPGNCFFLDYPPNTAANVESSVSRPLFYAMHPTNPYDIRFFSLS